MRIEVISPHDCGADFEITGIPKHAERVDIEINNKFQDGLCITKEYPIKQGRISVNGLLNNCEHTVRAIAYAKDGSVLEKSGIRKLYPNYIPGKCIAYIHPYDSVFDPAGRYFGSPSIVKLPNGDLLASHDLFIDPSPNRFGVDFSDRPAEEICVTKIYKSSDNGLNWNFLCDIKRCTFGKLFTFKGKVYIIGLCASSSDRLNDPYNLLERNNAFASDDRGQLDIGLFCSEDFGATWGDMCNITGGRFKGNFHKAATPVVEYGGRLWTAVDTPKDKESGYGVAAASVSVDDDIMNPENWSITAPFIYYDKTWENTVDGVWPYMLEEANAVPGKDGCMYVFTRYNSVNYDAEFINNDDDGLRVGVFKADVNKPDKPLEFVEMRHFMGSLSKFTINYDEESEKYYSLVSRATEKHCCQRNILSLVSSADLINWKIERDCLNIMDLNWYQNCQEAGLYYCDWVFDGNDIIAVCRTGLHDCVNYHNSNMMTFHRFTDFRERNYVWGE